MVSSAPKRAVSQWWPVPVEGRSTACYRSAQLPTSTITWSHLQYIADNRFARIGADLLQSSCGLQSLESTLSVNAALKPLGRPTKLEKNHLFLHCRLAVDDWLPTSTRLQHHKNQITRYGCDAVLIRFLVPWCPSVGSHHPQQQSGLT